tara:strand:- start:228 stop:671 length:444 start_codon:yes stop_codon:yes gene_type:complete
MKFETKSDKKRQEYVVGLFCNTYNCTPKDLGDFAPVDYLLYKDGKPYFYLEVKGVKKSKMKDTDMVQVAIRKIVDLQTKYVKSQIPAVICWAFEDGIAWKNIDKLDGMVKWGGRAKREGSTHDQELMFKMSIHRCKQFYYDEEKNSI